MPDCQRICGKSIAARHSKGPGVEAPGRKPVTRVGRRYSKPRSARTSVHTDLAEEKPTEETLGDQEIEGQKAG
jgi:hypothetical protein